MEDRFTIDDDRRLRLDCAVAERTGLTRSRTQRLMDEGSVLVNGVAAVRSYRVRRGDVIDVRKPASAEEPGLVPQDLDVPVLYADDSLAVVDKPAGMVVYPAAGHASGTLMNDLRRRFAKLATVGGPLRPGVVHRLDKDTSGVMVIALDDDAYYDLARQFRDRTITRAYVALLFGNLAAASGEIALTIGRSESDRKKMTTRSRRGKEAVTRWTVLERFGCATLVEARLGTGRTHQIRVHFSATGHPVLGDQTYGRKSSLLIGRETVLFLRQMLHARTLGFVHPATGKPMEFESPIPEDMAECLSRLREFART